MQYSQPLIGIPCKQDVSSGYGHSPVTSQNDAYLAAVSEAGAIPLLIPLNLRISALRRLYDLADGILLTGGGDIDPVHYNQVPQTELVNVQAERDRVELTINNWAAEEGKPVLGICRGIQVMAIAAGGALCQDLPTQMGHAVHHMYPYNRAGSNAETYLAHQVELDPASHLAEILQSDILWVNSLHHQAVVSVPSPMKVVGCSSDGVIEVIEHVEHPFFLGVQWHPELLVEEQAAARLLFAAFVKMCRRQVATMARATESETL